MTSVGYFAQEHVLYWRRCISTFVGYDYRPILFHQRESPRQQRADGEIFQSINRFAVTAITS